MHRNAEVDSKKTFGLRRRCGIAFSLLFELTNKIDGGVEETLDAVGEASLLASGEAGGWGTGDASFRA